MTRFSEAARDGDLWTTSPVRSRDVLARRVRAHARRALDLPSSDGLRDALYEGFTDLGNYAMFDDVPAALDELTDAGLRLGIVSNFEAWLEDLLALLGVRDRFPVRVISGLEGLEKPDPRIYGLALERSRLAAAEVAFVGDNPEFDVYPPAAIGMFPVLIDRRGRHPDHDGAADHRPPRPSLGAGGAHDRDRVRRGAAPRRPCRCSATLLPRVRDDRRALIRASERIASAVEADGGGVAGGDWFEAQRRLRHDLTVLAEAGILLRDPETGLVDFPADRDGRRVFLCWRLGEERVAWFHEERGGVAGRKPL